MPEANPNKKSVGQDVIEVLIGGQYAQGLKCPERATTIVSLAYVQAFQLIGVGPVEADLHLMIGEGDVDIAGCPEPRPRVVLIGALQGFAALVGADLLVDSSISTSPRDNTSAP
jgi:hypothetical protein